MRILRLDHAALLVKDRNKSKQFYERVLGMEEVESHGNCWLRSGEAFLHLLQVYDTAFPHALNEGAYSPKELAMGHISHVAFEVEDMAQLQEHLVMQGITVVCGPRPGLGGGEQLYICDPDGYVIELFTAN
jgi:catechol 2,3-dioxygenase-like lactoylglutathione lyase family enzyme